MKKLDPKRIMRGPPTRFGIWCATALLIACVVLPDELFGYKTPLLFGAIIFTGFLLLVGAYCLWVAARAVFGRLR